MERSHKDPWSARGPAIPASGSVLQVTAAPATMDCNYETRRTATLSPDSPHARTHSTVLVLSHYASGWFITQQQVGPVIILFLQRKKLMKGHKGCMIYLSKVIWSMAAEVRAQVCAIQLFGRMSCCQQQEATSSLRLVVWTQPPTNCTLEYRVGGHGEDRSLDTTPTSHPFSTLIKLLIDLISLYNFHRSFSLETAFWFKNHWTRPSLRPHSSSDIPGVHERA